MIVRNWVERSASPISDRTASPMTFSTSESALCPCGDVYLSVLRCTQWDKTGLSIARSSSSWVKLESSSFPSPRRARPWRAKNLTFSMIFSRHWPRSAFSFACCDESISPTSGIVLGAVTVFITASAWHFDCSCLRKFFVASFQLVYPFWIKKSASAGPK